jgi:hypothetical protein
VYHLLLLFAIDFPPTLVGPVAEINEGNMDKDNRPEILDDLDEPRCERCGGTNIRRLHDDYGRLMLTGCRDCHYIAPPD